MTQSFKVAADSFTIFLLVYLSN